MATIDKAAIGFTIGIVAVAMGYAAMAGSIQDQQFAEPSMAASSTAPDEPVRSPSVAAEQGSIISPSGLGAELNKERWAEDPFGDEAAKVRAMQGN